MAKPPTQPQTTPRADAERLARQAREAAALRDNLRKRRAQSQIRKAEPPALPERT